MCIYGVYWPETLFFLSLYSPGQLSELQIMFTLEEKTYIFYNVKSGKALRDPLIFIPFSQMRIQKPKMVNQLAQYNTTSHKQMSTCFDKSKIHLIQSQKSGLYYHRMKII